MPSMGRILASGVAGNIRQVILRQTVSSACNTIIIRFFRNNIIVFISCGIYGYLPVMISFVLCNPYAYMSLPYDIQGLGPEYHNL